ncbi:trace amine-associated receptor 13c-like [Centroberyx affinis]|uniref:trace amine-associated receptor 13c-like n=1 Tax=Centroberyx affinis TaxID=166261 RepID=UPI003A5C4008
METLEGGELCFPQLLNSSCRKLVRRHFEATLLYILLSSVSLLTVALNLLVIISISHYRQLHTPTNLLLLSLAVSDFLLGLLMPAEILLMGGCWFLGDLMCVLYYAVVFAITSTSVGNMLLISVDRHVAICDPLRYSARLTRTRVQICICLCWLCSVFYNCLLLKDQLRWPDRYNSCHGERVVIVDHIAGAVDLAVTFICPVTVIVVLYMRVFVVAVSQARAMRVVLRRSETVTAKKSERKAARTLGVVVAVFLICFFPYYTPSFTGQDTVTSASSAAFVIWLLHCNSCLNPVIYAFFYPWFRKTIKLIVTLQILQPDSCKANIL